MGTRSARRAGSPDRRGRRESRRQRRRWRASAAAAAAPCGRRETVRRASERCAFQRQRVSKSGGAQDGLDEDVARRRGMEVLEDVGELEAVLRTEGQDDGLLVGGRLQLEAEADAELLAQRQPPGAVDPRAERGVHDELRSAALVEESLEHHPALRRHGAEGAPPGARRSRRSGPRRPRQAPLRRRRRDSRRGSSAPAHSARSTAIAAESSRVRPGASPSQKGCRRLPFASATRTTPGSTRRIRQEVFPSWKMSPTLDSIAQSSLTVPTRVPSGSMRTW